MKTLVCNAPGQLTWQETTIPKPKATEVLLKVRAVGMCGTDLHAYMGEQPFFSYPRILGHELATEIVELPDRSTPFALGDRPVLIPYISCGTCAACRSNKPNCCVRLSVFGVHQDGGMQEYIAFPAELLLPSDGLSVDETAIVEPLAIGAHALRRAQPDPGEWVVVVGCGPIGMGIIQLAKVMGLNVVAVDVNETRLGVAKAQFGANHTLRPDEYAGEQLKDLLNGDLGGVVIDATGNKRALEQGHRYMRHGGKYVLVGLFNGDLHLHHPSLHAKETTLCCSRNATKEDFNWVIQVLKEKKFSTHAYITRKAVKEEITDNITAWAQPTTTDIKIITEWSA